MSIDNIKNLQNYKMLKCLKCGSREKISRQKITYPFSLKYNFLKAIVKKVPDQREIFIPVCKDCRNKISIWNTGKILSEFLTWIFISLSLVSLFLIILCLILGTTIPPYVYILIFTGIVCFLLSIIIYTILRYSKHNPNNFIKIEISEENSIIMVRSPIQKRWVPFKVWLGNVYLEGIDKE
ncbi:MAG: hypothetical protein GF329_22590 [Candidatus Lokiarchaeota archaeon]|nr:hypothetical protein [Candidatus Lokiarchaeota archaeon]